jgi:hypothetical protein
MHLISTVSRNWLPWSRTSLTLHGDDILLFFFNTLIFFEKTVKSIRRKADCEFEILGWFLLAGSISVLIYMYSIQRVSDTFPLSCHGYITGMGGGAAGRMSIREPGPIQKIKKVRNIFEIRPVKRLNRKAITLDVLVLQFS